MLSLARDLGRLPDYYISRPLAPTASLCPSQQTASKPLSFTVIAALVILLAGRGYYQLVFKPQQEAAQLAAAAQAAAIAEAEAAAATEANTE
jgi:hypothetical protein